MLASKPYVSSANYIDKMSDYCQGCHYHKNLKISDSDQAACPFNSLYWNFYMRHADKLQKNVRLSIVYQQIRKMDDAQKNSIQQQAQIYLDNLENL
jgi:deoxyribodipyrimidine photolyase-related protein